MKILKTVFVGIIALSLVTNPAYGGPEKGKGKAKGHEKQNQAESNTNRDNQSGNAQSAEKRATRTERGRRDANVRANIPDHAKGNNPTVRANLTAKADRNRSADRSAVGKKDAKTKLDNLANALNRLHRARWSHNPHDKRGQGNMGKPKMRDPYGHDKDSDREKSERGRPIRATDTDGDGIIDSLDTDDDNDGVIDTEDLFPLDAAESGDADQDGIGDNADTDDDNDGVIDTEDAFPYDATKSQEEMLEIKSAPEYDCWIGAPFSSRTYISQTGTVESLKINLCLGNGATFRLCIWEDSDGKRGTELARSELLQMPQTDFYGWVEVNINTTINTSGYYWIGVIQETPSTKCLNTGAGNDGDPNTYATNQQQTVYYDWNIKYEMNIIDN